MDTNSYHEILHYLKLESIYYSRSTLGGNDWGIDLPPFENTSMFHIVTKGQCMVTINGTTKHMQAGDLVFISQAYGHQLKAATNSHCQDLFSLPINQVSDHYETIDVSADEEPQTKLLCGVVRISHPAGEMLLNEMPELLYISRDDHLFGDMVGDIVRLVIKEASGNYIGGETVITRLADVLLIQVIRSWFENETEFKGHWLQALKDEKIGRALSFIHTKPQVGWTVEKLGREVGLSRTAFSNRFTQLVGKSVLNYLTQWRMNLALMRIKDGEKVNSDFSESLGYQSESAFRRAFKKTLGINISEVNMIAD